MWLLLGVYCLVMNEQFLLKYFLECDLQKQALPHSSFFMGYVLWFHILWEKYNINNLLKIFLTGRARISEQSCFLEDVFAKFVFTWFILLNDLGFFYAGFVSI